MTHTSPLTLVARSTTPAAPRRPRAPGIQVAVRWLTLALLGGAGCSSKAVPAAAKDTDAAAMDRMPGMEKGSPREGAAVGKVASGEVAFTAAQVQHGGIRWAPVALGMAGGSVALPGVVAPDEDRTARLGAPAGGRVVSVRVSPGDRVTRGQVLVTLVSPEAGMAQADLSKAGAALTSARAQSAYATSARARAERLLALKAIPRQDYERAIADDALAQATLAQAGAEARRARSTATQLGGGSTVTGEIVVRAPLDGVVLARSATPGTVVDVGAPLVVVTDPSTLWLTVSAPEALAAVFHRGETVAFRVPAYPEESFAARVDAVGAGLDPETRTLSVRAVIENASHGADGPARGRLKPEMLATVSVAGGASVPAVLLPEDAVQLLDGKPSVFLAVPDGKGGARFTARAVETGARGDGRVAVTRGIVAGDVVVTAGAFRVKAQIQTGSMPAMEM